MKNAHPLTVAMLLCLASATSLIADTPVPDSDAGSDSGKSVNPYIQPAPDGMKPSVRTTR